MKSKKKRTKTKKNYNKISKELKMTEKISSNIKINEKKNNKGNKKINKKESNNIKTNQNKSTKNKDIKKLNQNKSDIAKFSDDKDQKELKETKKVEDKKSNDINEINKDKHSNIKKIVQEKINDVKSLSEDEVVKNKVRKTDILVWSLIGCLSLFSFLFFNYFLMPNIDLKKGSFIKINYKEKYKEPGYVASYQGESITDKVKVSGKVDSNKLGTYKITYKVKYGSLTKKVVRTVEVADKSAPTIILKSKGDIYVCPGGKYKEEKYQAIDNYDGDVTKKVKVIKTNNSITYTVKDKAGNTSSITRNIFYEDRKAPVIKLKGGEVAYVFVGDKYKDLGYEVVDNCDGDLTKSIKIEGNVDTSKPGKANLTYTVRDKAGNESKVNRQVVISERGKNGTIYLTFDDGPKEGTTNVILDILKEEGIKATFFVTSNGPDDLIKREYDEGHTVALHTSSHNYATVYASVDSYFNDLNTVSDRVKRITGVESKIIRFPGGSSNTISRRYSNGIMSTLTNQVLNMGYHYFDWNLSSGDAEYGQHSAEEIKNNVINNLSKTRVNVVLMHDIKPYTRDALKDIITYGKNNGYTFENITMSTEMVTQRVNN